MGVWLFHPCALGSVTCRRPSVQHRWPGGAPLVKARAARLVPLPKASLRACWVEATLWCLGRD